MMVELMIAVLTLVADAPQQRVPPSPPSVTAPRPPVTAPSPPTARAPGPPISPTNPPQPSQLTIPTCPSPQGGIPASTGNSAGTASGPVSGTCNGSFLGGVGGPTVPH
jgi:hypothetical protein